jgi:hypothetical protein
MLNERGMLGAAQRGVVEQGVDRGQAGVAGGDAVVPVVFQVVQETADEGQADVSEVRCRRRPASSLLGLRSSRRNVSR